MFAWFRGVYRGLEESFWNRKQGANYRRWHAPEHEWEFDVDQERRQAMSAWIASSQHKNDWNA